MCALKYISLILMIIGSLNWGLVGLVDFNLVHLIFGESLLARLVYILVGLAGVYGIYMLAQGHCCSKGSCDSGECRK